jgi:hypothetical protein
METNKILSFQEQNQLEHDSIRKEAEKKAKELLGEMPKEVSDQLNKLLDVIKI